MVNSSVDIKLDTDNGFKANNSIRSDICTESFTNEENQVETKLNTKFLGVKQLESLTKNNANNIYEDNKPAVKYNDTGMKIKSKSIVVIKLSKSQFLNYYKTKTQPESENRVFTCILCKYQTNQKHIQQHLAIHLGEKSSECRECGYKSASKNDMVRHKKLHLTTTFFKNVKTVPQDDFQQYIYVIEKMSVIKKRPGITAYMFKCQKCNYHTLIKRNFDIHILAHNHIIENKNGHQIYKCNLCSYSTPQKYRLQRHAIGHTDKYFSCKLCQYKTTQNHHLKRHILIKHTKENMLKCNQCYFKCFYKSSMRNHKKKHVNGVNFWCRECNYRTVVKANFDMHIHNVKVNCNTPAAKTLITVKKIAKSKPSKYLQCTECDYRTVVKANFDMHIHNMERLEKLGTEKLQNNVDEKQVHNTKPQFLVVHEHKSKSKPIIKKQRRSRVKHFQCSKCNYTTNVKKDFDIHIHNLEHVKIKTAAPMVIRKRKTKSTKNSMQKRSTSKNSLHCSKSPFRTTVKTNVIGGPASWCNLRNEIEIKKENLEEQSIPFDEYSETALLYPPGYKLESEIKIDYDVLESNPGHRLDNLTTSKIKVEISGEESTSISQLPAYNIETTYLNVQGHNIKQVLNKSAQHAVYTNQMENQNVFCIPNEMQMNVLNNAGFMYIINPVPMASQHYFYQFINSSVNPNYSQFL